MIDKNFLKNKIVICEDHNQLSSLWNILKETGICDYYNSFHDEDVNVIDELFTRHDYIKNKPIILNIEFSYGFYDGLTKKVEQKFWFYFRLLDEINHWEDIDRLNYQYFFREEKIKRILE